MKSSREKITTLAATVRRASRARAKGECVVFTNGCFDLLHIGHIRSLEQARSLGDRLVVAINSDASVRRIKGRDRPLRSARQRMEIVAALGCVDWVVGFGGDTPLRAIRAIRPAVIAKGGDWGLDEIVGRELVESWGGSVKRLRVVPGQRTTTWLEEIRNDPSNSRRRRR